MKKHLLILALISLSVSASAAGAFSNTKEATAQRRLVEQQATERDVEMLKASQDIVTEMQKSNALNAEISAKLDKLIESSAKNNLLMETLLQRTE